MIIFIQENVKNTPSVFNVQEIIDVFYLMNKSKGKRNITSEFFKHFQDLHLKERLNDYTRYVQSISLEHSQEPKF